MPINRYGTPVQQPLINTYAPLPYQEILQGLAAKEKQQASAMSGAFELGEKEFQFLGADRDKALTEQNWLETESNKLAGTDLTTPEGKRAHRKFLSEGKKKFGQFGAIGAMQSSYNARQALVKKIDADIKADKTTAVQKVHALKKFDEAYGEAGGIGIGEDGIYNVYQGQDIARAQDLTKEFLAMGNGFKANVSAWATPSRSADGRFRLIRKGTNEEVTKEELTSFFEKGFQGSAPLKQYVSQGLEFGSLEKEELYSAIEAAIEFGDYNKRTAGLTESADQYKLADYKNELDNPLVDWHFSEQGMQYQSKSGLDANALQANLAGFEAESQDFVNTMLEAAGAKGALLQKSLDKIDWANKDLVMEAFGKSEISPDLGEQMYGTYMNLKRRESLAMQKDREAREATGYTGDPSKLSPELQEQLRKKEEELMVMGAVNYADDKMIAIADQWEAEAIRVYGSAENVPFEVKEEFKNKTIAALKRDNPKFAESFDKAMSEEYKEIDPKYAEYNKYVADNSTQNLSVESSWNMAGLDAASRTELQKARRTLKDVLKDPSRIAGYPIKSSNKELNGKSLKELITEKDLKFIGTGANSKINAEAVTVTDQAIDGDKLHFAIPINMNGENEMIYISTDSFSNDNIDKVMSSPTFRANLEYNRGKAEGVHSWQPPAYGGVVTFNYDNEYQPVEIGGQTYSLKDFLRFAKDL